MDIFLTAETELNLIDQQIAALQRRQVSLREFVTLGRKLFDAPSVQASFVLPDRQATEATGFSVMARAARPRDGTVKARILETTEAIIKDHGRIHTKALIERLEANGIEIGGADKTVTVSVILSRSERFKADRSFGWGMAEKKENPQDATTSAGSQSVQTDLTK